METNAGTHDHARALAEARDLNAFLSLDERHTRMAVRTASFCMERSGHYEDSMLNDQGLSFFLPNATWLQPPGYVHAMIAQTLGPGSMGVQTAAPHPLSASASRNATSPGCAASAICFNTE